MQKPDRSSFTTLDFQGWEETGTLSLTPKFQRRAVWKMPARAYLVDTILKGLPVPPIYLRVTQNEQKTRTIREVIDGQQRLRAVLDFVKDNYALSRAVSDEAPGRRFSALSGDQQDTIRRYSFICESFSSISDQEVLEVFARLNTYSVALNAQELRNGRYFGHFKRCAYRLAYEHLEFWRRNRVFTDARIARMDEVELTSELLVAQLDGAQDKKGSLDDFYANYDEEFKDMARAQDRFRAVIDAISSTFGDDLHGLAFRRPPLFYTLFCVVYHRMYRLPKAKPESPASGKVVKADALSLKDTAAALSDRIASAQQNERVPESDLEFVNACLRQTDNIRPREIRFDTLYKRAFAS